MKDYEKLSQLGKGTYGEVHKCKHLSSGLIVAIKSYKVDVYFFFLLLIILEHTKWN